MSKKTSILGISAFYHDAAAALVIDGKIVAAAQEERFSRKKHDASFPIQAVHYCLREAGMEIQDLSLIGFYDKPMLKFERILETYLSSAPFGFGSFVRAIPLWLHGKLHLRREMNKQLRNQYKKRYIFAQHHESHAASSFYPSPFAEAAILTIDGVGEWATASYGVGKGSQLQLNAELKFPHSLGLLYSAFTYYCGFKVNSGEYKLMGLAPYGEPCYTNQILEKLIDLRDDGSFRMNMEYFNYCRGLTMTSDKFNTLFGGTPRKPEAPITKREMDLAASIQDVTEDIMMRMAIHVYRQTKMKNLCLAGGVALNCVSNGKLLRDGPFEDIWIQPAAGDAGGALGVALFAWHQLMGKPRNTNLNEDIQKGTLLGPSFCKARIEESLSNVQAEYTVIEDEDELCNRVSILLSEGKVVGWFQGRMEFGPRALGARSILGDARAEGMQTKMNLKIKFRESFRPFAPVILEERVEEYFDLPSGKYSPYMLLVAPVAKQQRINELAKRHLGFDQLKNKRSSIPAVTHVDYSARVQTVSDRVHPRLSNLLQAFEKKTGCPVLINTSFNVRGEPIVCTPEDAFQCFMATDMDVLVIEDFLLIKNEQTISDGMNSDKYLSKFELD